MMILKVTKNQSFTLSLEDAFWKNHRGRSQIDPPPSPSPPSALLGLKRVTFKCHENLFFLDCFREKVVKSN